MTYLDVLLYYSGLLIMQYLGLPKAKATVEATVNPLLLGQFDNTVQTLVLSDVPASGAFTLTYGANNSASINWNDTTATISTDVQAIIGDLAVVSVTGSLASKSVVITLNNTYGVSLLGVGANTLKNGSNVAVSVTPTGNVDEGQLPIQVSNGFAINTTNGGTVAVGNQLDVVAKYVGVVRSAATTTGTVTLSDADLLTLVNVAIARNKLTMSLEAIQNWISTYFAGDVLVFDYSNMQMSYLISSSAGNQSVILMTIAQHLLPRPMGVAMSVIYAPVINKFFGFRTYAAVAFNSEPFNDYSAYQTTWPWLSYKYVVQG